MCNIYRAVIVYNALAFRPRIRFRGHLFSLLNSSNNNGASFREQFDDRINGFYRNKRERVGNSFRYSDFQILHKLFSKISELKIIFKTMGFVTESNNCTFYRLPGSMGYRCGKWNGYTITYYHESPHKRMKIDDHWLLSIVVVTTTCHTWLLCKTHLISPRKRIVLKRSI